VPTYEYACTECGNRVEVFQRIGDEPLTLCERCGGALRKVFHPAGIVFKGSGFYATDSRTKVKTRSDGERKSDTSSKDASSKKDGGEKKKEESKSKASPASESSG
jgi:putative FmdB family regulatory protein